MTKNLTRETLYNAKRVTYQRMNICIEVDVPEEIFDRDSFNQAALTLIPVIEKPDPEVVTFPDGCRVVLVSSEDVKR